DLNDNKIDNNNNIENNLIKLKNELNQNQVEVSESKLRQLINIENIDERNEILIKKLQLCCALFEFNSTNQWHIKGIEKKTKILSEISEFISKHSWYNESVLQQCIVTISKNLFRTLPRIYKNEHTIVEDEQFEDPSWTHLQLVY